MMKVLYKRQYIPIKLLLSYNINQFYTIASYRKQLYHPENPVNHIKIKSNQFTQRVIVIIPFLKYLPIQDFQMQWNRCFYPGYFKLLQSGDHRKYS